MTEQPNPLLAEALGDAEGRAILIRMLARIPMDPDTARTVLDNIGQWIEIRLAAVAELLDIPLRQRAPHIRRCVNDFLEEAIRPALEDSPTMHTLDDAIDAANEHLRLDVLRDEAMRQEIPIDDYSDDQTP